MARTLRIAGLLVPLLLVCGGALADDAETAQLREQLRSTVLQLRQLQDQQAAAPQAPAAAPADDAASKARLGALQTQLRAARARAARTSALQAELDKAKADNATLTATATQNAADFAGLKAAYAQSADQGRVLAADNNKLKDQLATMTRVASACQVKNDRLTGFAENMLTTYSKVGFGQALASHEPFLGLARVRLENIAQDREDQVRSDHCDPRLDAAPPARTAGG